MSRLLRCRALLALVLVLPLSGCLFRSHKVERQMSTAPLKSATQQELIDYINSQAAKIRTMQATVDIDASTGGEKKGKITDYQEIRGYVLARKPAMLRMIGLMPIVRNKAFDMVSDGQEFKLWIPPKNRFIVGHNEIVRPSPQPLENLRPQHISDALLLRAIDPQNEIAVLENGFETVTDAKGHRVQQPDYEIEVIRKGSQGWFLSRKIIFSRTDLLPHRQLIYDEHGNLVTDARYEDFKDYDGIKFPTQIDIWRPQEEYSILLKIVKLQLNQPLTDDQFALQQPPGAVVVNMDERSSQAQTEQGSDGK
jgi:outer membrane lipoprotein-sorting protein